MSRSAFIMPLGYPGSSCSSPGRWLACRGCGGSMWDCSGSSSCSQWCLTKGRLLLLMVANPMSQLTVIENFVAARAAAEMGWRESAVCMFSLGIVHYLVLFVTLYQRLSGDSSLPAMLSPVFLFIAAPSMASLPWDSISGCFDTPSISGQLAWLVQLMQLPIFKNS